MRRRRPPDNSKGTLPLQQRIKTKIKYEKNIENIKTNFSSLHFYTSAGTPGQHRICSVRAPPVYVQFMYLCASVRGYLPAVYTAGTAGICIQACSGTGTSTEFRTGTGRFGKFGTTSMPVPEHH